MKSLGPLVFVLLVLLLAGTLVSRDVTTIHGFVPAGSSSSLTVVTTRSIVLQAIVLNNTSTATTCNAVDAGTDCTGAACKILPTDVPLAATTIYSFPLYGVPAPGGVKWSCASGGTVVGTIKELQ